MANNSTVRKANVIKNIVGPISESTKTQIAAAVQEVVNRIKDKHL
jgi:DNA-binding cell septation regulator SpoVG